MGYISECPEGMGLCSRAHASERRDVPGLFAKRGRCLTRHLVASPQCRSLFNPCRFNPIPTRCLPGTPPLTQYQPGTRRLGGSVYRLRSPMPSGHSTRLHFNISTVFCNCPLFNCSRIAIKGKLCGQSIQLIMSDALAAHYVGH